MAGVTFGFPSQNCFPCLLRRHHPSNSNRFRRTLPHLSLAEVVIPHSLLHVEVRKFGGQFKLVFVSYRLIPNGSTLAKFIQAPEALTGIKFTTVHPRLGVAICFATSY
jgi:hypothetical protein